MSGPGSASTGVVTSASRPSGDTATSRGSSQAHEQLGRQLRHSGSLTLWIFPADLDLPA
jgi:hypothetical protein